MLVSSGRLSIGRLVISSLFLLVAGCASTPQAPVPLAADAIRSGAPRIGVAMSTLPKTNFTYPGAGCLLCIAAASMANSTLIDYTRTLPADEFSGLPAEIAELLRKKGQDVVVIDTPIDLAALPKGKGAANFAPRDFSQLGAKYQIDRLFLIELDQIGIERTYTAYVPTGDPKGTIRGSGSIVDLKTNGYQWYSRLEIGKSSDGAWDEPPKFPGLTNAYFQAIELAKDQLREPFLR